MNDDMTAAAEFLAVAAVESDILAFLSVSNIPAPFDAVYTHHPRGPARVVLCIAVLPLLLLERQVLEYTCNSVDTAYFFCRLTRISVF